MEDVVDGTDDEQVVGRTIYYTVVHSPHQLLHTTLSDQDSILADSWRQDQLHAQTMFESTFANELQLEVGGHIL
jgi:hypothetical protein